MPDFIPSNDDAFLAFVTPYSTKITATPTAFGLTSTIATALSGKVTSFTSALAASNVVSGERSIGVVEQHGAGAEQT